MQGAHNKCELWLLAVVVSRLSGRSTPGDINAVIDIVNDLPNVCYNVFDQEVIEVSGPMENLTCTPDIIDDSNVPQHPPKMIKKFTEGQFLINEIHTKQIPHISVKIYHPLQTQHVIFMLSPLVQISLKSTTLI